jgi:oxysterol 7-alpha-hydroxylase
MLEALDTWCDTELEPWDEKDGVWNEKWGIKLNWERERMARDHNMTLRGRSCVQVSFLWV